MAEPSKTAKGKARLSRPSSTKTTNKNNPSEPPAPFRPAPEALKPFYTTLPPGHVYITHMDPRPASFKRKLFLVPVAMNVAVACIFVWRMAHILPYYLDLAWSALGHRNSTTVVAAESTWRELGGTIVGRAFTFLLDFLLAVFVWPWPYEFVVGAGTAGRGSPVRWRWAVGFRDREIYVRRSRPSWDRQLAEAGDLLAEDAKAARDAREVLMAQVRKATAPMLLQQKTGYLTMDGDWDLDWAGMVTATRLVDQKNVKLEAFGLVVLLHHERFGWLTIDLGQGEGAEQDERRRQVFAFRDALAQLGKEDLFFRWVEMIQFETTQPGGFTAEKQAAAAKKIRDMFKSNGVDFDELWKETVGTDGLAGMP
jgi:hypothetical protein